MSWLDHPVGLNFGVGDSLPHQNQIHCCRVVGGWDICLDNRCSGLTAVAGCESRYAFNSYQVIKLLVLSS